MQAVIYARYSSHNQTEQSIEGQLRECTEYAEKNGLFVVKHYIDRAKTGTNDNRAAFQQMLKDSEKCLFDAVIVWKIDRFGRNREEIAINKVRLRKNGVRVLYAQEHIPDTPEGVLIESCLEGVAEYYSKSLSQGILRGMRTAALKCHSTGRVPALGYGVSEDKSFHIVEHEAAVILEVFKMFAAGRTQADIIRHINGKGYRTTKGNIFGYNAVRRILTNRQYIGEYQWHDILVKDGMPRIVSDELFAQCQERLEKNKKRPPRKVTEFGENFLLTGKIFCGKCGSHMVGDSGTSSKGYKYFYYTCTKRKHKKGCSKGSVRKEYIEDIVIKNALSVVYNDKLIDKIAGQAAALREKEVKDNSNLNYLEARLRETETALKNIIKAIEAGIFTATTKARLDELEAEKREIKAEIDLETLERPTLTREHIAFFLESFRGGDVNDEEYKQRVIDTFVNSVYLYDEKIIITYNYTAGVDTAAKESVDLLTGGSCSDMVFLAPPDESYPNFFISPNFFGTEIPLHM